MSGPAVYEFGTLINFKKLDISYAVIFLTRYSMAPEEVLLKALQNGIWLFVVLPQREDPD